MYIMPNTSWARNTGEAVWITHVAKNAAKTDLIKIEIINDNKHLLPDNYQTAKMCEILAKEGFKVFAYMNADLYATRDMLNAGRKAFLAKLGAVSDRAKASSPFFRIILQLRRRI
ncbi:hypothetical protein ATZ36_15805 [Candidatus Endomicrobiellum trichonymphae]|uniref:thiazole synthase n=1 Tax=Endomicrobium trichonymphae TaxID=1408204 RepID=A0A1E5ILE2_ENDTX|nr:hypothetical protein ATZ36_15805 [Candidatus Endomicrobium trichonymphae]